MAAQFNLKVEALAKPFRMVIGALYVNESLGLTDCEIVQQIIENYYI